MSDPGLDLRVRRPLRPVDAAQVAELSHFHKAVSKMVDEAPLQPKSISCETDIDAGQLSKILSGQAGIIWEKLEKLMDACGSELPLFWMLHRRGYEISGIKKRQSELEKQLEIERAEKAVLQTKYDNAVEFISRAKAL